MRLCNNGSLSKEKTTKNKPLSVQHFPEIFHHRKDRQITKASNESLLHLDSACLPEP